MATHRYKVGKVVETPKDKFGVIPPGPYEVVRQLPPARDGVWQYRVKSMQNGHERIIREDQLLSEAATS
jgi:hypothetical protein